MSSVCEGPFANTAVVFSFFVAESKAAGSDTYLLVTLYFCT